MRSKAKFWIPVILRAVLLICCWIGVNQAILPKDGGFMESEYMLYFTDQSNIWVLIITTVYLALGIKRLVTGSVTVPRCIQIARFTAAVSITITFLVFWLLLAPSINAHSLLSLTNQMLHTVVPILFVADFLLFDRGRPMSKTGGLWAILLPLYYLVFSLIHAAVYPEYVFSNGRRYAYFFLNVDKLGWFGFEAGIGVFWWILILLVLTLAIGYLYRFIQQKTIKTT